MSNTGRRDRSLHIVVVGGGFGGLAVLAWLRRLCTDRPYTVTLVSERDEMALRPLYPYVIEGTDTFRTSRLPLGPAVRRLGGIFLLDRAERLDPSERRLYLTTHDPLPYDVAFLAPGHDAHWDILATQALPPGICTDFQASATLRRLQDWSGGRWVVAVGDLEGIAVAPCDCMAYETILVVDAALRERVSHVRSNTELVLVTPRRRLLDETAAAVQERVAQLLQARDIRVVTDAHLTRVDARAITLVQGGQTRTLPCDVGVVVPPYRGPRLVAASGLGDAGGWGDVDERLRSTRADDVYVVGDAANALAPKTGHNAMVQARVAVHDLMARLRKVAAPPPYRPRMLDVLVAGRGRGLLIDDDVRFGGHTSRTLYGTVPHAMKRALLLAYRRLGGNLPILP